MSFVAEESESEPASSVELIMEEPRSLLRSALPPGFRHAPVVQHILNTLEDNDYLAFLSGRGVQYLLRGLMPPDNLVISNCPPETMARLLPTLVHYDAYSKKAQVYSSPDIHLICAEADSAAALACVGRDFTINRFFVNARGELSAPLPETDEDFANRVIRTISPMADCPEQDAVLLWQTIACSSELAWPLDPDTESWLMKHANQLGNMTIQQFIVQFNRCFAQGEVLAWRNFYAFQRLGLLPWLVARQPGGFNNACYQFCLNSLTILFKNPQSEFFLADTLAVFALLNCAYASEDYQRQVAEWMQPFKDLPHSPGLMRSLEKNLSERLALYYDASHRPVSVPVPYAGLTHTFFAPPPARSIILAYPEQQSFNPGSWPRG